MTPAELDEKLKNKINGMITEYYAYQTDLQTKAPLLSANDAFHGWVVRKLAAIQIAQELLRKPEPREEIAVEPTE